MFDQFVRRRANQVYLGYFVGLGIYAYVVLAAVQKDTPPTIELGCAADDRLPAHLAEAGLLSQMRPIRVILAIKTRALNARERELELVCRARRAPRLTGPPQLTGLTLQIGYVNGVLAGAMSAALTGLDDAEVEFLVSLGQHVVVVDPVASVEELASIG